MVLTVCGTWKDFVYVLDDKTDVCELQKKKSGVDYIERESNQYNIFKYRILYGFEDRSGVLSLPYLFYTYILRDRHNNGVFVSTKLIFRIVPTLRILKSEFEFTDEYIFFLDVIMYSKLYDISIDVGSNDLFTVLGVSGFIPLTGIVIPKEMLFYMMRLYNTTDGIKNVFYAFNGYLSDKMQFFDVNGKVYSFSSHQDIVESEWK